MPTARCFSRGWAPVSTVGCFSRGWVLAPTAGCCRQGFSRAEMPQASCQNDKTPAPKQGREAEARWPPWSNRRERINHSAPQGRLWTRQKARSAPGRSRKLSCAPCSAAGLHRTQYFSVLAQLALPETQEKVLREPAELLPGSKPGSPWPASAGMEGASCLVG